MNSKNRRISGALIGIAMALLAFAVVKGQLRSINDVNWLHAAGAFSVALAALTLLINIITKRKESKTGTLFVIASYSIALSLILDLVTEFKTYETSNFHYLIVIIAIVGAMSAIAGLFVRRTGTNYTLNSEPDASTFNATTSDFEAGEVTRREFNHIVKQCASSAEDSSYVLLVGLDHINQLKSDFGADITEAVNQHALKVLALSSGQHYPICNIETGTFAVHMAKLELPEINKFRANLSNAMLSLPYKLPVTGIVTISTTSKLVSIESEESALTAIEAAATSMHEDSISESIEEALQRR